MWEDGPEAGGWIADLLGPFGPTVAGAVPRGHPAHAIVPVPRPDDTQEDPGYVPTLEALIDVLAPFARQQHVHCAMWEGWAWWHQPIAGERVEQPGVRPLELPYRAYHVWRGPLESVTAFRHHPHNPPSLIWPEDRSWFVGIPIYSNDIAVAGSGELIDAMSTAPLPGMRRAARGDVLDIDD